MVDYDATTKEVSLFFFLCEIEERFLFLFRELLKQNDI